MNKFYLIDKPIWLSSFDVLRKLKKILNFKKMWHTWTLDPLATGALLVAVWNYTKLIPYFEKDTKEYIFKAWLDWVTETFDLEKEVTYISDKKFKELKENLSLEDITTILEDNFLWDIEQVPPKYSALKIWWKKALDMARAWEDFEMKKRKSKISEIEILNYNYPDITIRAVVSAWTYIRSIAFDLWAIIWAGWYIKELRRTKIWRLNIIDSISLDDFDIDKNLDIKKLFPNNNFIKLDKDILSKVNNWLMFEVDLDFDQNQDLFVTNWEEVTNIIRIEEGIIKPQKRI